MYVGEVIFLYHISRIVTYEWSMNDVHTTPVSTQVYLTTVKTLPTSER